MCSEEVQGRPISSKKNILQNMYSQNSKNIVLNKLIYIYVCQDFLKSYSLTDRFLNQLNPQLCQFCSTIDNPGRLIISLVHVKITLARLQL